MFSVKFVLKFNTGQTVFYRNTNVGQIILVVYAVDIVKGWCNWHFGS